MFRKISGDCGLGCWQRNANTGAHGWRSLHSISVDTHTYTIAVDSHCTIVSLACFTGKPAVYGRLARQPSKQTTERSSALLRRRIHNISWCGYALTGVYAASYFVVHPGRQFRGYVNWLKEYSGDPWDREGTFLWLRAVTVGLLWVNLTGTDTTPSDWLTDSLI